MIELLALAYLLCKVPQDKNPTPKQNMCVYFAYICIVKENRVLNNPKLSYKKCKEKYEKK
jgi:hypothetical protein